MEAMYVREETQDLLPGEPYCAPLPFVMVESHIELVRKLHHSDHWVANVSTHYIQPWILLIRT
jgi:hypothetical protein